MTAPTARADAHAFRHLALSVGAQISDFGLAKVLDVLKDKDDTYVMTGETGSYR